MVESKLNTSASTCETLDCCKRGSHRHSQRFLYENTIKYSQRSLYENTIKYFKAPLSLDLVSGKKSPRLYFIIWLVLCSNTRGCYRNHTTCSAHAHVDPACGQNQRLLFFSYCLALLFWKDLHNKGTKYN